MKEIDFIREADDVQFTDNTRELNGSGPSMTDMILRSPSQLSSPAFSSSSTFGAHATKFLCPRFNKYEDAPSETFTVPKGSADIPIETCGWEVQIFVDRKPEVICTYHITFHDSNDGSIQINDFLIEPNSDLGCGSFCTYHVASCTKDFGLYAIKSVSKTKAQRNSMLFKQSKNPFYHIEREASILKQIYHPNIAKLFEIMDDPKEDILYFVFEYMDRGSILVIPTDAPLQEPVAISYFRDVLYGVEYLHSKNIIHRDLKPENMLLNSFGRVKLVDFGLSFVHEEENDRAKDNDSVRDFANHATSLLTANWIYAPVVTIFTGTAAVLLNILVLNALLRRENMAVPFTVYLINLMMANIQFVIFGNPLDIVNSG
ncbi:calcium/calmodulin-dependent protein kinase kinase 2-like [Paramacrobiotus metropolitanus]|uniref:calcium/calmodulin-dependent protein kinase kinase 2-like n=1 Tax=Paramacrobiotus metropolitanus TaxID=2943436 RepID=UPI002445BFAB|nr:calcium/calmodulin-dependent protein kinase kinase 2-like [Paramacrobiotus metropolitanus]